MPGQLEVSLSKRDHSTQSWKTAGNRNNLSYLLPGWQKEHLQFCSSILKDTKMETNATLSVRKLNCSSCCIFVTEICISPHTPYVSVGWCVQGQWLLVVFFYTRRPTRGIPSFLYLLLVVDTTLVRCTEKE